jgi:inosose dehydratase
MAGERKVKIGHTGITWKNDEIGDAAKYLAKLGFSGLEAFASVIAGMEKDGTAELCAELRLPIVSAYCSLNLVDPAKWDEALAKLDGWAALLARVGCKIAVLGGDGLDRRLYSFKESQERVVWSIDEIGKRLADKGVLCCFHPHTGTPVESEYEIRAVMEAVDGKAVFFAPDIGQIQKGGTDALKIVKDYYQLIRHMHFKDYVGGPVEYDAEGKEIDNTGFMGYVPLGRGVVDLKGVLGFLEEKGFPGYAMVELDGRHYGETEYSLEDVHASVLENKEYLEGIGYSFA